MAPTGESHPTTGAYAPMGTPGDWAADAYELGAHQDGDGVTFAVFSRRAHRVLLELYEASTGKDAAYDYWLAKNPGDHIWRIRIRGVPPFTRYAFRCWGPNWRYAASWTRGGSPAGFVVDVDAHGNRFNPNKVLIDPYARELTHDPVSTTLLADGLDSRLYATGGDPYLDQPQRELDSGHYASKAVFVPSGLGDAGTRPRIARADAAIYEAHVRGVTQHPSASQLAEFTSGYAGFEGVASVPPALRGTYAGAGYLAPYLKALGFSAIELLPVHDSDNDTNDLDPATANYWAYMSLGYFAPDRRYAADKSLGGPTREFKAMVKAFHDAGMEVYLDVVYNHSGEGGNWERDDVKLRDVVSFTMLGGFDVVEYYVLNADRTLYDAQTGCGNQMDFNGEATQNLVLDSLRYWIGEMGVDGFRFDLAVVLGRGRDQQFQPDHPLLLAIRDLGEAHEVEMIAEAWAWLDYQVGNFPRKWGEWNGRYRDSVREFLRSDPVVDPFIRFMNGDYRHFHDQGGPHHSVNFLTAHDGFTLLDLVSYNEHINDAPAPFGRSDGGGGHSRSWDSDGDQILRRQRLRNFWTVLAFSRGVPMAVWGDEFGRTQNGNDNAYNLDTVCGWSNYAMLATHAPTSIPTSTSGAYHDNFGAGTCDPAKNPLFAFVVEVMRFRSHSEALRQAVYGDFVLDQGADVTYLFRSTDGLSPLEGWQRCVWLRIDGSEVGEGDLLVLINMHWEGVSFAVPGAVGRWRRMIDTAHWAEPEGNFWPAGARATIESHYYVHPRSVVVLREESSPTPNDAPDGGTL